MSDNVKAVGFESMQRENPNLKRLASVWVNSPEYETWLALYADPENKTIEYYEEDNHKIATFYRLLDEAETTAMSEPKIISEPEEPEFPEYQVIKVTHEHADENQEHKVTLVKLGIPRWVAIEGQFGLCEYVLVDQYKVNVPGDEDTKPFTFLATRVSPSDENETDEYTASPIYQAPSFMDVWEAMFAIGEYPVREKNAD